MYVVTFYSFKGGVGRTMALANVAMELVRRGRRVLVVDFDLEAPGIPTFAEFRDASERRGLVDYVLDYIGTGNAPDVREFVCACGAVEGNGDAGNLWVMPAGRQDSEYPNRLNSIDWQRLYREQDGYLMFEDMKAQWANLDPRGIDYVLVDSRTGHTDVGGICTRQLPDAVAVMFYANEQNLSGLRKVIGDIRSEKQRGKYIDLHFVMSNVPDLDDENDIMQNWFVRAMSELKYEALAATIHHYGSLELLNQEIFTVARPRTRLAQEYRHFVDAIVSGNLRDRDGAKSTLFRILEDFTRLRRKRPVDVDVINRKLEIIAEAHGSDGEILSEMAKLRELMGDAESAVLLLNQAVNMGHDAPWMHLAVARIKHYYFQDASAVDNLRSFLSAPRAEPHDVRYSVHLMLDICPGCLVDVDRSPALLGLDSKGQISVARALLVRSDALVAAERVLRGVLDATDDLGVRSSARHWLSISLIAQGRFSEAASLLFKARELAIVSAVVSDIFNYAVAEWGCNGFPSKDLFARVLQLPVASPMSANMHQCLAIAHCVVGDVASARESVNRARRIMDSNPVPSLSVWSYLIVSPLVFGKDLDRIGRIVSGGPIELGVLGDVGDRVVH